MKPGVYEPLQETDRDKAFRKRFYQYREFLEGKRDTDPFEEEEAVEVKVVQGNLFGDNQ